MSHAAVVDVLVHVGRMETPETLLDPAESPHERRDAPRSEKDAHDHIAENPEIEGGDAMEKSAIEIEEANGDLHELDRPDHQRTAIDKVVIVTL